MSLERTTSPLVQARERKYRTSIPEAHQASLDTRLRWLWHQRFGTVQNIWSNSRDMLDHTACTLVLQAIMGKDLDSISQLFQRLEGGAIGDAQILEQEQETSIRV